MSIILKILSAILGGRNREQKLGALLLLNKPNDEKPLLSADQLSIINKVLGYSGLQVTTTVTAIGSIAALLIITLKSAAPWTWWIFIVAIIVAFITWGWVYTGDAAKFADKKFLDIPKGTWVLVVFCLFDILLATLSVLAVFWPHNARSSPSP